MNATRKRLLYKATHRGTKEADKIIGGYAEAYLDAMTEDVLASFDRLLDESDHAPQLDHGCRTCSYSRGCKPSARDYFLQG